MSQRMTAFECRITLSSRYIRDLKDVSILEKQSINALRVRYQLADKPTKTKVERLAMLNQYSQELLVLVSRCKTQREQIKSQYELDQKKLEEELTRVP